jgi:MYXO-CTERM domain-containing protein
MRSARLLSCLAGALTLTAALAESGSVHAFQAPPSQKGHPLFELADGSEARAARDLRWFHAPPSAQHAWAAFQATTAGRWHASWDAATGVPARIWGSGVAAPGSVASPAVAEAFARAFLKQHLALLAPGASPADFVLSSNDLDGGLRTVGFFQHHHGLRVVGGQVSFRFKNDRLFVIGSEALPHVQARATDSLIGEAAARSIAAAWVMSEAVTAQAGKLEGPMILPLVAASGVRSFAKVVRVVVDAQQPLGRFAVYLDAQTGTPVAREQLLRFAQGQVFYDTPVRYPLSDRKAYPAHKANLLVDGAQQTSDAEGMITFADGAPAAVTALLTGPLVMTLNDAGAEATKEFSLDPGASFIWNDSKDNEKIDAQISTFVHVNLVKQRCKEIAPQMSWLNSQVKATVNLNDQCNAFSDGTDVNFFLSSAQCENTGRIPDVNYHEFGHSFHFHAIIPGAGAFDGALSEGQADYLAATMTGDPGTARGFFKNNQPLRDLESPKKIWPQDVGEIHDTGIIIGGALWDLRVALVAKYGEEKGVATTDQLYYQSIRRASDIPTMYVETIAANDDDGDLENGTPDICEINAAYGAHGLRPIAAEAPDFGVVPPSLSGYKVTLAIEGLYPQCEADKVDGATLTWKLRKDQGAGTSAPMTATDNLFEGLIPTQPEGEVVEYKVTVQRPNGPPLSYPDNLADPLYQFFVGEVVQLYFTDFEKDPKNEGWTHGLSKGKAGDGADDWQWGISSGAAGSGDPVGAYSGKKVFGNDLGNGKFNGIYQPDKTNFALSPVVQVGDHKHVHLQYRRWLNVEDGNFDHASIYANGTLVWRNFDSMMGDDSHTQHQDKEWRFHDVDLSAHVKDGAVQVKFEIESDPGLELGGWTLDDVAIVAWDAPRCGDGELGETEACDDGADNSDTAPNACRSDCQKARCGDGVADTGEACDDGNDVDTDTCTSMCEVNDPSVENPPGPKNEPTTIDSCGCRVVGGSESGGALFAALGLVAAAARRRRSSRRA